MKKIIDFHQHQPISTSNLINTKMKPKRIRSKDMSKTKITNTSEMLPLPNICKRESKTNYLISAALKEPETPLKCFLNDCAKVPTESQSTSDCSTDNESTLLEEALLQWQVSPELRELYKGNRLYCQLLYKSKLGVSKNPLENVSKIIVDPNLKKKKKKKKRFSDGTSPGSCGLHRIVLEKIKTLNSIPKPDASEIHTEPRNDFVETGEDSNGDESEAMSSHLPDHMQNHFLHFFKTSKQIDSFRKYIKHQEVVDEATEKKCQKRLSR